ncbi:Anti-sigma F factor antagonist [Pseudobythopirellula maris]|uniref:Anti-sigma F factor antagonist n=1 Tax=Pseudobythopirellula maris TaxID=2527991 RepID=A0A5C5ZHK8_9BACT|nr:STAS domain-containing protein [Pseudobythopirellula maris]TWT86899.1 Anti-sigma F factor antagonist [Pseudobythopirellula maris]
MAIASHAKDGILFVRIDDARLLEESRIEQLEQELLTSLNNSVEERVVINFAKVQFMSSSMLGKLVKVHKKAKEFKVKVKFCSIAPDIQEVFKITRLDKLFDIEKDEETARKAFLKRGIFG